MERRNLDKAMELFSKLIVGEEVSRKAHADLYEAYSNNAEVFDILDAVLKKLNLHLYEYNGRLSVCSKSFLISVLYRYLSACPLVILAAGPLLSFRCFN